MQFIYKTATLLSFLVPGKMAVSKNTKHEDEIL